MRMARGTLDDARRELVKIVRVLRPVLNYKGV